MLVSEKMQTPRAQTHPRDHAASCHGSGRSSAVHVDTQTHTCTPICAWRQTQPAGRPSAPCVPLSGLGSLMPPPATCLLVGRGWGCGGNSGSVFPDTQLCVCSPTRPSEPRAAARLRPGGCGLPSCGPGARPPVCTHRRLGAPGQPHGISAALGVGREAQGNELAEISRASYLPTQASSHKSQNRVPGRDVSSEMQRQLQRKTVESDRQESCLLSPRVSEGSLERARARRGHRAQRPHPPAS